MQPPFSPTEQPPFRRWLKLLLATAAVAAVWLIVLPWIGTWPVVREKIQFEQSRGIDPSAMFYTELEAMPSIIEEIDRLHLEDGNAFWQATPKE